MSTHAAQFLERFCQERNINPNYGLSREMVLALMEAWLRQRMEIPHALNILVAEFSRECLHAYPAHGSGFILRADNDIEAKLLKLLETVLNCRSGV